MRISSFFSLRYISEIYFLCDKIYWVDMRAPILEKLIMKALIVCSVFLSFNISAQGVNMASRIKFRIQ